MSGEVEHGTRNVYTNHKCRCDACRAANRDYQRRLMDDLRQRVAEDPSQVPHGISGYTNWGCRCEACKAANAEWCRRKRAARRARKAAS